MGGRRPIYGEHPQHLPGGEAVPDKCYRIIVREDAKGEPKVLAYIVPQTVTGREPSAQFLVSVDQIEQATHLDFLRDLPDGQERKVEAVVTTEAW